DVGRHLRAMHEVGLLGRFLPEFGRLTNLVQHEFYHQYAVDEHTLTCLEKLDRVWSATERPYANYTALLREIEKPSVLHLALLLHDSGKADKTGHHEIIGGELALKAARRLKLDGATTHTLRLIIELHLAMVQVSQRRDLEDREVISEFAGRIQTREQLDLLTLHTFADSMGTSDTLWNGFKDTLLWTLYHKTADYLAGETDFIQLEVRQRELLQEEVRAVLPRTFAPDEIAAHFGGLPARYFRVHPPREIARDLTLTHQFMHLQLIEADRALEPVVNWQDDPDRGYATVHICTWDRAGLFSKIAGALTAAGLNIHSAEIYTRQDGIVLDTFAVTDAATGALPPPATRERFSHILTQCLVGVFDLPRAIARAAHYRPLWQAAPDDRIATRVRVDNRSSPGRTVIDI
ncbi:MAG: ACT domain-containing protein, partial [Verrucomicrobiota bacterium]